MTLRIDDEFKALIPPLLADEKSGLEASILSEGCRDPIIVWGDVIIDGHNRFEICTRSSLEFQTVSKTFESREQVMLWMIDNQRGRRNLTDYQKAQLGIRRAEILRPRAKENQGTRNDIPMNSSESFIPVDTRKSASEYAGVSEQTISRVKKIEQKAPEEVKAAVSSGQMSINEAYKSVRREEKKIELDEAKKEIASELRQSLNRPIVYHESYETWIDKQEMADLILTDPPYTTDIEDIESFAKNWLPRALSKMKRTGRAYVFIGAYPKEIAAYLSVATPDQILVWTYRNTLGPSPKDNYKLNWQAILYFKGPDAAPLNCPIMLEQFSVQDISAPDGRQFNRYHEWQKPDEIAERFIRHSTKPGDIVIDPFCCTGTFPLAAARLGRVGIGCDISIDNLLIAEERGCELAR